MARFAFLVNDDGYKHYTYLAAERGGASVPHIANGVIKRLFEIHNAEPANRIIELPFKWIWYKSVVDETKLSVNEDNYFILYESFHMSYSRRLIRHYKKKYPKAKFLYFFTNPAGEYNLNRLNRIVDLLDGVYSFNEADRKKYGFRDLEIDPFLLPQPDALTEDTDVFFVGADKGRLPLLLSVFESLSSNGLTCDFWITGVAKEEQKYSEQIHYNQRLTYEEVLIHDAKTRCILEVLQDGKTYSSIRTTEAIQYKKKLLTTNTTIRELNYYNPNIFCAFTTAEEIPIAFILDKADDSEYSKVPQYSFKAFEEFVVRSAN